MKKKIVVFAPHPDDETWGCGGSIAKKISEGFEVIVVIMTDGRYAFSEIFGINSDPTPEELKEIRKEEVIRSTKILGVPRENLTFLDFRDGSLEEYEEEAKEKIIEILKEHLPVEIYFPYKKDCHPDHRVTCRIVQNSLQRLELTGMRYQYSILRNHSRIGPLIDKMRDIFKKSMIDVDISEFLHVKEQAAKEFKSEISIISSRQERPLTEKLDSYLKDKETFYVEK